MPTTLRAGLAAAALLPLAAVTLTPAATAAPTTPPAGTGSYWTCTFSVNEGGVEDVTIAEKAYAAGEAEHRAGDVLNDGEELVLVGSVAAKPTEKQCLQLMSDYVTGVNDPTRTVALWTCLYQTTEQGLVFIDDPRFALVPPFANPGVHYVTPAVAKESPVGHYGFGEGILDFTVAHTERGAKAPTKAACDAMLPEIAKKAGLEVPGQDTPKPQKPGRGVPAHTGVGM